MHSTRPMESFDRYLVLVCDADTGDWSIMHESKDADSALDAAEEKRKSGDKSPIIAINTADFINFSYSTDG